MDQETRISFGIWIWEKIFAAPGRVSEALNSSWNGFRRIRNWSRGDPFDQYPQLYTGAPHT